MTRRTVKGGAAGASGDKSGSHELARDAIEMIAMGRMLGPFHRTGYALFPLSRHAKVPRDRGWQTNEYAIGDIKRWLEVGGNIGVLLAEDDLVLDIDPRHGGEDSLARLQVDLNIDFNEVPAVLSGRGDGGRHLYLKKPADLAPRKGLAGYAGIDIKTRGGFVLAPGSRHPETGGVYQPDPGKPLISNVTLAPASLLEILHRPAATKRAAFGGGELTTERLDLLLHVLDPADYRDYPRWFRIAAASHDATNGDSLDVWLSWAARDAHYGTAADDEKNTATWLSLTAGKAGGTTYLHLLNEVARAGRIDLVLKIEPTFVLEHGPASAPDFSISRPRIEPTAFAIKRGKS